MKSIMGFVAFSALIGAAIFLSSEPATARSGGSETIKVSKCYYFDTGSYVELLVKASSSNTSAHLYAYLPSGQLLGEVQNGGGGRYGGTVFVTTSGVPATITINSSAGASITAPTAPLQL